MSDFEMNSLVLLVAFVLEMVWIEGKILGWGVPHIVCGLGNLVSGLEKLLYAKMKINGLILVLVSVFGVFFLAFVGLSWLREIPVAYFLVSAFLTYQVLAGSLLIRTGNQVFEFLENGDLALARERLTWLVGRDTQELTKQEVRQAALESMAENLSDGMIAPMFYFLLAGLPGMMAYKMINTLDSRFGYKNEKFAEFGYFSAKLDDVANWVPARITALLMAFSAPGSLWRNLRFIWKFGRAHLSPNAGYPEAALAGVLNCQFGGAHDYGGVLVEKDKIGEHSRSLNGADVKMAARVNRRAAGLFFCIGEGILMGMEMIG